MKQAQAQRRALTAPNWCCCSKVPKRASLIDAAEEDVLAFPRERKITVMKRNLWAKKFTRQLYAQSTYGSTLPKLQKAL
jgi:hypothetical protein